MKFLGAFEGRARFMTSSNDSEDGANSGTPDIAALFAAANPGNPGVVDALFAALYTELHRLARRQLVRGRPGLTMGTTTLLHEAYLGMSARSGTVFPDRGRFMGYAARAMRGLIIDHARQRNALKRGGGLEIASLDESLGVATGDSGQLARLGDAIDALSSVDAPLAQLVDLKFFCGFSFVEIAEMRGVSERTVQRQWEQARIYLHRTLGHAEPV